MPKKKCVLKGERIMKKVLCLIMTVIAMATMFTGCGSKFTCDLCDETKSGKKYEIELMGDEFVYCKDCYKNMKQIANMFQ